MILVSSGKWGRDLLTFQKRKLYYNRYRYYHILLPYQILLDLAFLFRLTMQNNLRHLKCSFIALILLFTLILCIQSQTFKLNKQPSSLGRKQPLIQLQAQALNIPSRKKDSTTFLQFKLKFNRKYNNPQQEVFRSIVYIKNRDKINANNLKPQRKYNMALNSFADLTPKQFSEIFTATFKSDSKIKRYSKKVVQIQSRQFNSALSAEASLSQSFRLQKQQLKEQISSNVYNQKEYLQKQNGQFSILQQVFQSRDLQSSTNRINKISDRLDEIAPKDYFSVSFSSIHSSLPTLMPSIPNYTPPTDTASLSSSIQDQFNQLLQSSNLRYSSGDMNIANPLRQTGTSTTSSTLLTTSGTGTLNGNFSSIPVDWTVHAGKIKYQGICGACYTFATSDALASIYSIYKYGFFVPLSTQQVIDCSTNGLTYGCNGGFLQGSYAYMQIKGIQTDFNYPYTSASSGVSSSCKKDGGTFKISSFKNIQEGNCRALVSQLNYGPISIGIAGYRLQFYSEGIFNDCNSYIDHAVVLIAYKGGVGWKIKNSWGADWGMSGFAWIADGNNCGICNMAVSARL